MSTFVLVHGAWHGAWCWDRVVPRLEAAGRRTVVSTLTGLGERAAELTPEIGLAVHADDVITVLGSVADPVVMVGHSYSGLVVRQAADRCPDAVERLVLVDASFGGDDLGLFGLAPLWSREAMEQMAIAGADGWRIPPPPPELVGVTEPRRSGVAHRASHRPTDPHLHRADPPQRRRACRGDLADRRAAVDLPVRTARSRRRAADHSPRHRPRRHGDGTDALVDALLVAGGGGFGSHPQPCGSSHRKCGHSAGRPAVHEDETYMEENDG